MEVKGEGAGIGGSGATRAEHRFQGQSPTPPGHPPRHCGGMMEGLSPELLKNCTN